jgi:hypothetical protein
MQLKLTPDNLRRLAVLNGYSGVDDLAVSLGRARQSLYEALKRPNRYGPTFRALDVALPVRLAPARRLIAA